MDELSEFLPLSNAVLHILAALAGEERHGYGIMQEVARQSGGSCRLGPGTLYDNLDKLMSTGLVERSAAHRGAEVDPRRRYYRLSRLGRRVLAAEIARLEQLVRNAKAHLAASGQRLA